MTRYRVPEKNVLISGTISGYTDIGTYVPISGHVKNPDVSLPSAQGRFRPGLSAKPFGLGDRKATHSRLGTAKVPQPGVDLMNMAAPA
jgi:hypothetical protein